MLNKINYTNAMYYLGIHYGFINLYPFYEHFTIIPIGFQRSNTYNHFQDDVSVLPKMLLPENQCLTHINNKMNNSFETLKIATEYFVLLYKQTKNPEMCEIYGNLINLWKFSETWENIRNLWQVDELYRHFLENKWEIKKVHGIFQNFW